MSGDRARVDGRAGNRLFQDQPAHEHGPGPVRPKAVEPGTRLSRSSKPRWSTPSTPPRKTSSICTFRLCTASVPLAAIAQFAAPALLPAAAVLFAYTSIPTFKAAREVLVEEKTAGGRRAGRHRRGRLSGDHVDFPGNRPLLVPELRPSSGQEDARQFEEAALNAFGKQPRYVWLYRDGAEVQICAGSTPAAGRDRGQHRRGGPGRRDHRPRHGHDRSARADGRVDPGGERGW